MRTPWAGYDVLDKWDSPSFNDVTRGVLSRRLHAVPERRFLSADEFRLLEAIAARLVPQPDRAAPIPIAPWVDNDLFENRSEGFRQSGSPPLQDAWRRGLAGVEATARRRYVRPFADLDPESQDLTLQAIQAGEVDGRDWSGLSAKHFFVHLTKVVAGVYYSHPTAWSEIGFGGPASPRGYVRLGLNQRDPWEAGPAGSGGRGAS